MSFFFLKTGMNWDVTQPKIMQLIGNAKSTQKPGVMAQKKILYP